VGRQEEQIAHASNIITPVIARKTARQRLIRTRFTIYEFATDRSGVRTHKVSVSPDEIQNARKQLGLSQDQFADAFGVSASTLRKWEQGQRSPTGAAKTLLKIIEREPKAVVRALKAG